MDLRGKSVAIVGLGASGIAAAEICVSRGARVHGLDEAPRDKLSGEARGLEDKGVQISCGPLTAETLGGADLIVVSPGLPQREAIDAAERRGVPVISEVELASRFLAAPIALIGGTNGKSTVTALSHEMLAHSGKRAFIGGNYGTPLCAAVGGAFDAIVAEISSFQAERVPTLRARVHALLNVTEDHLDRYASFDAYARAKGNPFANMTADDAAVIPAGDGVCRAQAARGGARQVTFSAETAADVRVEGGHIVDASGERYPLAALKLRGRHNAANACASVAVARAMGASADGVATALAAFGGLAHRHVLVATIEGVRFYDDSKATNVGAAVAALRGMEEERAVLIAGGRDKLGAYEPLVEALRQRGRALVVLGEAGPRIEEAARGALPIVRATSIDDAVARAAEVAKPGDAVLLSPACSSYDMFTSYKARGAAFASAVLRLAVLRLAGGGA